MNDPKSALPPVVGSALDGLYWGDNVVWEAEEERMVQPFFAAIADGRDDYDLALYVSLTRSPEEVSYQCPSTWIAAQMASTGAPRETACCRPG